MKKNLTLLLLVSMGMLAGFQSKANSICFTDGFGYRWTIDYSSDGHGGYYGTGHVNTGSGYLWNVTAWSQTEDLTGSVELHAVNPKADGCVSYSDSFIYVGTDKIFRSGGKTTSYSGSGSWTSYCYGGVVNSGTWDASGPCSGESKSIIDPHGPASHTFGDKVAVKASNKICFTDGFGYIWMITYTSNGMGGYAGSGTVNIGGGVIWNAYGTSQFSNLSGTLTLSAVNPNPDGCASFSDSFVYTGNSEVFRSGGSTTSWTGSGDWTSYCFGGALSSGTWDGSGPCGTGKPVKVNPEGPASHGNTVSIVIAPNPVKSNASISVGITKEAKVQLTVYNYLQQPVKVLVNGMQATGKHVYNWSLIGSNGNKINAGLYRVVAVVDGKTYSVIMQVAE